MRNSVTRLAAVAFVACAAAVGAGCEIAESPRQAPAERPAAAPTASLVNRTWSSDDPAAAPGSIRVFLDDGTLLMTSCGEVYRLARWEVQGDGRIGWSEDGAAITAAILRQTPDTLILEFDLGAGTSEQRYTSAAVPFVCPSLR